MLNVLASNDYAIVGASDSYQSFEYDIDKLNKELKQQGYICIPISEYEKLKEDLEEAQNEVQHLYEEMAGEDL